MKTPFLREFTFWSTIFVAACFIVILKGYAERESSYPLRHQPSTQPIEANHRTQSMKRYSLGFDNFISATMWVQLLQVANHSPLKEGNVSWEFTYVDAITELDPMFQTAFRFGSTFLSVFKQDKIGANIILEKWVKRRPNYWNANYILGFHRFSEMGDAEAGSYYILRAAQMEGAPGWVASLGVRILSETGRLAQALRLSIELFPGVKDDEGRSRLTRRIRSLNFALQKKAWEQALSDYQEAHKAPPKSLVDLKSYFRSQVREIAEIINAPLSPELANLVSEVFPFTFDAYQNAIVPLIDAKAQAIDSVGVIGKLKT